MTDPARSDTRPKSPLFGPVPVGVLAILFGLAIYLMSDGEAEPAVILLIVVIGAACIWYGLRRRQ